MKSETLIKKFVWLLIFLYISFFGYISFLRYQSFHYNDWDLAMNSQILWNLLHGVCYSPLVGTNYFGHHAYFNLFLVIPVYFLFMHPLTLLFLKTISLGVTAFPLYLIAKEKLNEKAGLLIVVIYLLYPALGYTNYYEFQAGSFITLFLTLMFYFFIKGYFKRFVLFMLLSLFCQENISIMIFLFGFYAFFTRRDKKWVVTPILMGMIWFLVIVGVVLPYLNEGKLYFIGIYSHLGNSLFEVIKSIIAHPLSTAKIVFTKQKMVFLGQLFLPVSFLSLFDGSIFIVFPIIMQHFFSKRGVEHVIYFHYAAELIPFIFISAIYGVKRIFKHHFLRTNLRRGIFLWCMVAIAIISNIYLGPHFNLVSRLNELKKDNWDYQKDEFISVIPDNASVVSTFEFLPKLSHRKNVYSFHHVTIGCNTNTKRPFYLPESTQYALIDFNDFLTFKSFYISEYSDVNIRNFLENRWSMIDMLGSIVLLKRNDSSEYKLYQILNQMPQISNPINASIDNEIELLGYDIIGREKVLKGEKVKLRLYWKSLMKTSRDYGNLIDIVDDQGIVKHRFIKSICFRAFPTYAWGEGEIVAEDYHLFVPEDVKNSIYAVKLSVFDYSSRETKYVFSQFAGVIDDIGRVHLNDI
ncbi:MAG: DUF2079 domain-containing protein [Candidatus Saelkia tenebricola]|nr:DUF2079 domain-containing protein [Candidatus Saelkia tenebricola]